MNIHDNITKQVNLGENDGLSKYKNYAAQQHHDSYEVFFNFLKDVAPVRILEIGTALGGFTSFLKEAIDELSLPCNIRSYDIYYRPWYDDMIQSGIDVRVENIFNINWSSIDNLEVINYIQQPGTTVVLCDGGYKVAEFNLFSQFIKQGDFILAHDFVQDRHIFESTIKNNRWNWLEIEEANISAACAVNNLQDYNAEIFSQIAWGCKRKK